MPAVLFENLAHLPPLDSAPLFTFVVCTVERHQQLRMLAVEITEIHVEIRSSQFRCEILVIEHTLFSQDRAEGVCDLPNKGSLFSGK